LQALVENDKVEQSEFLSDNENPDDTLTGYRLKK